MKGCGALTGWSWSTGDAGIDQHAFFNLPFFIKDGCIERSIASAGGPSGISCSGSGSERRSVRLESEKNSLRKTRRFTTDVTFPARSRGEQGSRSLITPKRNALSENDMPIVDTRDITIAPRRLSARSEIEKLYEIDSRDLIKRGCLD